MEIAASSSGGGGLWYTLLPFILMFAVFYFLLIRPQQRKQKVRNQMLTALKRGDKVTTIGGIHGTIMEITDDIVVLRVNDATKITLDRSSVNNIKESAPAKAAKPDKETSQNDKTEENDDELKVKD